MDILKSNFLINKLKADEMPHWLMLGLCGIIGIIVFGIVWGFSVVDPGNDLWLYNSNGDLSGHYVGWLYYRKAAWQFPIGLQEGITYPYKFSVLYMDSIPVFALIFKVLSPILPETFQYFGIYGLLTYILQAMLGGELVYVQTENKNYSVVGSVFFTLSPTVLQRMFGHSALAFHPIILLAILIYLKERDNLDKKQNVIWWSLLLGLSVSIQAYFFPMVFAFIAAYYLPEIFSKKWYKGVGKVLITLVYTLVIMYVWGYFYGDHNMDGGGLGTYNSDINALINGQGTSYLVARIFGETASSGIGEAYAYLGFGIIILCGMTTYNWIQNKHYKSITKKSIPTIILVTVFVVVSVFPIVRVGGYTLLEIPLPDAIAHLCGTFRANGRFMWPIMYLIFVGVIGYIFKNYKHKYIILIICLGIQIADLSLVCEQSSSRIYALSNSEYRLKDELWKRLSDKEEIYFMYDPVGGGPMDVTMPLGKYAADNDMVMNDFYTSRKDSTPINAERQLEQRKILEGVVDDEKIYIFSSLPMDYLLYDTGLNIYILDDILIGVTDELDANRISIEEGINLLDYSLPNISNYDVDYVDPHTHETDEEAHVYHDEHITEVLTLPSGDYHIEYDGDNLDNGYFFVGANAGALEITPDNYIETNEKVSFDISVDTNYNNIVFICENRGVGEIVLTEMNISGKKSEKKPTEVSLDSVISFSSESYNASAYIRSGVSHAESGYSWTDGDEVQFHFILDDVVDMVSCNINYSDTFNGSQTVDIYVNDLLVDSQVCVGAGALKFSFPYPEKGIADIKLVLPDACSPVDMGMSEDSRDLALQIQSMVFSDYNIPNYVLGTNISFEENSNSAELIDISGVSKPEVEFTWTEGKHVHLSFKVDPRSNHLKAILKQKGPFNVEQQIVITANGVKVYDELIKDDSDITFNINNANNGIVDIMIEIPDACSPKEIGQSEDSRLLGLRLESFRCTEE